MQDTRMGLGTDQLELPDQLAEVPLVRPPTARVSPEDGSRRVGVVPPPLGLVPWAARLHLPGVGA